MRSFHLLLVEDNSAHAKLATMAIRGGPVPTTVKQVSDGEQALAYLTRQPPHQNRPDINLVLLDLKTPKVDGIDVLRQIKRTPDLRSIPVVVLSSALSESEAERAYRHHANSYLVKPLSFDEFQRMMNDLLVYWGTWNEPA
jgi:CheY-like chemotaxis protein